MPIGQKHLLSIQAVLMLFRGDVFNASIYMETVDSEKPSSVAVLDSNPVRLAPTTIPRVYKVVVLELLARLLVDYYCVVGTRSTSISLHSH